MTKCMTDIPMETSVDKAAWCKYYDKYMACYPKCYCDDALYKSTIDASKKSMEIYGCTSKCGVAAAAGLRTSAFTVFIAAVVSLVAAR